MLCFVGQKQPGVLKYVKRGKTEDGEEDVMIFIPAKNTRAKQTKTLGKLCENFSIDYLVRCQDIWYNKTCLLRLLKITLQISCKWQITCENTNLNFISGVLQKRLNNMVGI